MVKLTALEIKMVNAMRNNEYNDAIEGATWVFTAIMNSGIEGAKARGVISSLVQKGLVQVAKGDKKSGDEDTIWFTKEGQKLFDNADGEKCQWGGKPLLKEIEIKGEVKTVSTKKGSKEAKAAKAVGWEVEVVAFTGMKIGKYPIVGESANTITIEAKSGKLVFDKKTGIQTNAKNPKFANRIKK